MGWIDGELALIMVAAMLSPTTLTFSIFALVIGDRPLRTGTWFYIGALGATLLIGVVAAFVIGDVAASNTGSPKTWVAVIDVIAAVVIFGLVVRYARRPPNPARTQSMMDQMNKLATAPILAIIGAGATLANPGGFIPLALKDISETDPSAAQYMVEWTIFALVSLLPLLTALLMLLIRREWALRVLGSVRDWLQLHAKTIALVIVTVLALSLLRNGIAGLTS